MGDSANIGRVGALAASLGVGAAVLMPAIAAADAVPADGGGAVSSSDTNPGPRKTLRPRAALAEEPAGAARPVPRTDRARGAKHRQRATAARRAEVRSAPAGGWRPRPERGIPAAAQRTTAARLPAAPAPATPAAGPNPAANPLAAASSLIRGTKPAVSVPPPPTLVSPGIRTGELRQLVSNPDFLKLCAFAAIQFGVVTAVGVLGSPPSPTRSTVPLVLNGYNLVPSSTRTVKSFYGEWTYLPGLPSAFQGDQEFDVVEATTGNTVGSFDAVVSQAGSFNYTELLVTATDGVAGTGPGDVPPVGSLLSRFTLGPPGTPGSKFGFSYSALPAAAGGSSTLTINTPLANVEIPLEFDAAVGIADRTVDNRPVALGNGYTIAPTDPTTESLTAVSGLLPIFTTVQGNQQFSVYDPSGMPVGGFDAVFTTTSDILGTYTQALLVTSAEGPNVGTGVGQIPPVGTVYNVIYTGADENYFLYTAMPTESGAVITLVKALGADVTPIEPALLDAVTPPSTPPLSAPSGHTLVPVSGLRPIGVNGLPPRDVQIQGYRQFDAYDASGHRLGAFEAQVASQWDMFGIHSEAILVTAVHEGTTGPGAGTVPSAGSVFDFVFFGDSGFAIARSVIPGAGGASVSAKLVTPVGDITLPGRPGTRAPQTEVVFLSPSAPSSRSASVV